MTRFLLDVPNRQIQVVLREPPEADRWFEIEIGPLAHLISPLLKAELVVAIGAIDGRPLDVSGYVLEKHRRFTIVKPVLVLRRKEAT